MIEWKAPSKRSGAQGAIVSDVPQKVIHQTKFYNNLRNRVTELRKKHPKLLKLKNNTYPYIIEWLKKYDNEEKYGEFVIKYGDDLISVYKAVETYKVRLQKDFDNEDELVDYINKLLKVTKEKFNFHKRKTVVDSQLSITANIKVSPYNMSLQMVRYITISDLNLIAEYDSSDNDDGIMYGYRFIFCTASFRWLYKATVL